MTSEQIFTKSCTQQCVVAYISADSFVSSAIDSAKATLLRHEKRSGNGNPQLQLRGADAGSRLPVDGSNGEPSLGIIFAPRSLHLSTANRKMSVRGLELGLTYSLAISHLTCKSGL